MDFNVIDIINAVFFCTRENSFRCSFDAAGPIPGVNVLSKELIDQFKLILMGSTIKAKVGEALMFSYIV
jgi:hypothetical protein